MTKLAVARADRVPSSAGAPESAHVSYFSPEPPTPLTGARLATVRTIAKGGMGRVELALRQEGSFRRTYAVKRLAPEIAKDPLSRTMFVDEARVAGLIRHPNVVSVVDVGEDEHGPFLVMDFVEGLSLARVISRARDRRIPVQVCARILRDVAAGLQAAHDVRDHRGAPLELVHRDISPQNILVGFDGVARLTDFGIAKAVGRATETTQGLLKGKVAYMAPEQLRFEPIDHRTDLYALGVVLHELVSGRRLFRGGEPAEIARAVLGAEVPALDDQRDDVPRSLASLCSDLLDRDPARRPAHARDVVRRAEVVIQERVQLEGPMDVGELVSTLCADEKAALERELASLWDTHTPSIPAPISIAVELPPDGTEPTATAPQGRVPVRMLAGAVAGAVLIAGVSFLLVQPPSTVAAPSPPQPEAEVAQAGPGDAGVDAAAAVAVDPVEVGADAGAQRRRRVRARRDEIMDDW